MTGNTDWIPATSRTRFPQISARSWEHPADRAALAMLRKVPGFDAVLRKLMGLLPERVLRSLYLSNAVRVTPIQVPRLYKIHREACYILDLDPVPELYVAHSPFLNAGAAGSENPFITLNSATVEALNDDEILSVLGHECGHILSGHVLYKTMLRILIAMSLSLIPIPAGYLVIRGIITALLEWDRKSELSADRAALITVQAPRVVAGSLMRLAAPIDPGQLDLDEYLAQAKSTTDDASLWDKVINFLNLIGRQHPFLTSRAVEVIEWSESEAYKKILAGEFLNRAEDNKDDVKETIQEAAKSYGDSLDDISQTAGKWAKDLSEAGKAFWDALSDARRKP